MATDFHARLDAAQALMSGPFVILIATLFVVAILAMIITRK